MKRGSEEVATIVEATINKIRSSSEGMSKRSKKRLISNTCLRNSISEKHIRKVAGWTKNK